MTWWPWSSAQRAHADHALAYWRRVLALRASRSARSMRAWSAAVREAGAACGAGSAGAVTFMESPVRSIITYNCNHHG